MDPITLAAIATVIKTGIEMWARHTNKPPGWIPTKADFDEMEAFANERTSQWYKDQAKASKESQIANPKS